jgi:hypothetical protein
MANDLHTGTEPGVTNIVTGIIHDLQELLRQELNLFRQEVKNDVRKTKEAIVALSAGAGILVLGAILLSLMLVDLLRWEFPNALPLWVCYAIVGSLLVLGGGVLFHSGKRKLSSFNPLPDQTVGTLRENVQWIMNPKK